MTNNEVRIAFIGSRQKCLLFDKLCKAAVKMEKHVNYQDTSYLTFNVDGSNVIVELVDPGLEHTGAREMSIRKAHGALLFYSAFSESSFQQLSDLVNDFSNRKHNAKLPIVLFGSEDDLLEEEVGETSSSQSSISEGYESETPYSVPTEGNWKRRPSMERIRARNEENVRKVTREQGESLARQLSPECKFISASMASFVGEKDLIETMIRTIRSKKQRKMRLLRSKKVDTVPKEKSRKKSKESIVDSAVCTIS